MPKDNKAETSKEFNVDISSITIPDWKNATINGIKATEYLEKLLKGNSKKAKNDKEKK